MNIRSFFCILPLTAAFGITNAAFAQSAASSSDVEAHHTPASAVPDGVLRLNGSLYIINNGVAHRIELADGQMATMDGNIHKVPQNYTAPATAPTTTTQGASPDRTVPAPTSAADRDRNVSDTSANKKTPSEK